MEAPLQLKLDTGAVDGATVMDCSGRIIFGEETSQLRDTIKNLLTDQARCPQFTPAPTILIAVVWALSFSTPRPEAHDASLKLANLTQQGSLHFWVIIVSGLRIGLAALFAREVHPERGFAPISITYNRDFPVMSYQVLARNDARSPEILRSYRTGPCYPHPEKRH